MFALHLFHCLHQNNIALSPAAPWEEGFIVLFLCGGWGRMGAGGRYKLRIHGVGRAGTSTVFQQAVFALCDSTKTLRCLVPASRAGRFKNEKQTREKMMKIRREPKMQYILLFFGQHRTIPALRLKHRSGSCGTASALPKCSIMSGCGTRIVLRGQKPLALCDRCPCFGSLFPPLAALTFAASSIICAFGLAAAAPRSPYRHLELCGIAFDNYS
ncbi:MAG: hypothetical protein ACLSIG_12575 [Subdoligranulum sp.]